MKAMYLIAICAAVSGCTTADQQFFTNAAAAVMTGYAAGSAYQPTYQRRYVPASPSDIRTVRGSTYSSDASCRLSPVPITGNGPGVC